MGDAGGIEDRGDPIRPMAPSRRIDGRSPVQSTTVEAGPPRAGPPSRIRSMSSPSWAAISAASRPSGRPERFAEVVGSGPTAAASARGVAWSGTRRPIVGGAAGERRREGARPAAGAR